VVNTGQACFSTERIYVDAEIFDEFSEKLCSLAKKIEIDYPDIQRGHIGPLISARQAEIVQDQIDDAVRKGAKILTGGKIENHEGGLWLRPTIMVNVDHGMKIMQEETFGPILPLMKFSTTAEAVALSNETTCGLSAAVFGSEADVALAGSGRRVYQ
jgi:acyl-CoA reductase-like NAD-dependent aldehyde dehydrogenase